MRLTTVTHVSVDGVMQGLGGAEEDRRDGFERGGWALPHFSGETEARLGELFRRADAFLFGRRTYEVFARSWGTGTWGSNAGANPISLALNTRPKYVVSGTITEPAWEGTTVLTGDLVDAVGALKSDHEGEVQVHGSGALVRGLLEHGLVDELVLLTYPVVLGQGVRLFPDAGPDVALDLVESRSAANGVTIQVYRPAGRPLYTAGPDPSSTEETS